MHQIATHALFLSLAWTLAPCAHAQDPAGLLPKDAQFIVAFDGPAKIVQRLAGTNLGHLVASPEAAPVRELPGRLLELVDAVAERGGCPLDTRALLTEFGRYQGRIAIGVHVDVMRYIQRKELDLFAVLVLAPDGEIDLAELAAEIDRSVPPSAPGWEDVAAGPGFRVHLIPDSGLGLTLPRVVDGCLVTVLAAEPRTRLAQIFAKAGELGRQLSATAVSAMGYGWLDPNALIRFSLSGSMAGMPGAGPRPITAEFLDALIARLGMQSVEYVIAPLGEYVRATLDLRADATHASMVDLFQPAAKTTPIVDLVPRTHQSWRTLRFDLGALLDLIQDVGKVAHLDVRAQITPALEHLGGIDLDRDLLAPLDGQLIWLDDTLRVADSLVEDDEPDELPGLYSGVLGLKDVATFEAALEKIVRSRGLHATRKSFDHQGVTVRTISLGMPIHYAFAREGLVIGAGEIGKENVLAVIDASLQLAAGRAAEPFGDKIRRRVGKLGAGARDLGVDDIQLAPSVLEKLLDLAVLDASAKDEELKRFMAPLLDAAKVMTRLVGRFDQSTTVVAIYVEPGRLRFEAIQ